jgi:DNA-binding LacI/PurR family transcriptional regulator
MKKQSVSYKDIGKALGVSPMTVSLAMRNHSSIPERTKRRIKEVAEELGYRPDPRMSELMQYMSLRRVKQDFPVLCFMDLWERRHDWKNSFYIDRLFKAARKRAEALGYDLQDFWLKEPHMSSRRMRDILMTRNILGILIPPLPPEKNELDFDFDGFCVVTTSYSAEQLGYHLVTNNRHQIIRLAIEKVTEKGIHRIGLALDEDLDRRSNHDIMAHFMFYQNTIPKKDRAKILFCEKLTPTAVRDWYRAEKPEVVISMNNDVYDWLLEMGLEVPGDVGFVTLSNYQGYKQDYTGVDERSDVVGAAAIDVLTAHLQRNEVGMPSSRKLTLLEGEWRVGRTLVR